MVWAEEAAKTDITSALDGNTIWDVALTVWDDSLTLWDVGVGFKEDSYSKETEVGFTLDSSSEETADSYSKEIGVGAEWLPQ